MFFYCLAIIIAHTLPYLRTKSIFCITGVTSPIVLFATLRGSSGKDTPFYLTRFYSADASDVLQWLDEPVLTTIALSAKAVGFDHRGFFAIHATIVCLLYIIAIRGLEKSRLYVYSVGPMFLIDGLTNGMRITLAYHLFVCGVVLHKKIPAFALVVLSHVTGVLMYVAYFATAIPLLRGARKVAAIFALLGVALASTWLSSYVLGVSPRIYRKYMQYEQLTATTSYSGLADISIVFVLFLLIASTRKNLRVSLVEVMAGIVGCGLLFVGVQYTLAFIRVGKLILVGLLMAPYFSDAIRGPQLRILSFAGLAYSANFLRQVFFDKGFLPYPGAL